MSLSYLLIIWNVAEQKAITRLDNTKGTTAHTLTVLLVSLNTHQLKTHIPPDMYQDTTSFSQTKDEPF